MALLVKLLLVVPSLGLLLDIVLTLTMVERLQDLISWIIAVGATQSGQAGVTSGFIRWRYADNFQTILPDSSATAVAAGCSFDLVNIAVIDEDGFFTGTKRRFLKPLMVFQSSNAKDGLGRSLFYPTIINETSQHVWWGDHVDDDNGQSTGAPWGTNAASTITDGKYIQHLRAIRLLTGGRADKPAGNDFITNGYELFEDSETVDVSILLGGDNTDTQARSIVDICDKKKMYYIPFSTNNASYIYGCSKRC